MKAVGQAGEASGVLVTFLSEMFKGSRMIRIYQKEDQVKSEANKVINDVIDKNVKTASVLIRAALDGNFNWNNDSWFYQLFLEN